MDTVSIDLSGIFERFTLLKLPCLKNVKSCRADNIASFAHIRNEN